LYPGRWRYIHQHQYIQHDPLDIHIYIDDPPHDHFEVAPAPDTRKDRPTQHPAVVEKMEMNLARTEKSLYSSELEWIKRPKPTLVVSSFPFCCL
jgi:hypothetical protein